jgi:hypothetical protein
MAGDPIGAIRRTSMEARRRSWSALWLGLAAVGAAGCGQSFDEGIRVICQSPAGAAETAQDPPEKAAAASSWVAQHLENEEARMFFMSLARHSAERKAALVRKAAGGAGRASVKVGVGLEFSPHPQPLSPRERGRGEGTSPC